jgi:hypothetical protein
MGQSQDLPASKPLNPYWKIAPRIPSFVLLLYIGSRRDHSFAQLPAFCDIFLDLCYLSLCIDYENFACLGCSSARIDPSRWLSQGEADQPQLGVARREVYGRQTNGRSDSFEDLGFLGGEVG